jgi:predicted Fe-Mo cluster-binding NifX family protein
MDRVRICIPTVSNDGLKDSVSRIFAKAPTFTFIDVKDKIISKVIVEENHYREVKQGVGPVVMKSLQEREVDIIVAAEMGPGAKTLMEMSGIHGIEVEPGLNVSKAVKLALSNFIKK